MEENKRVIAKPVKKVVGKVKKYSEELKSKNSKSLNLPEKKTVLDLNPVEVDYVYNQLFNLWELEKARKFIKHLISAFYPYNLMNQVHSIAEGSENLVIDAITNKKCSSLINISQTYSILGLERIGIVTKAALAEEDSVDLEAVKNYQEIVKNLPEEIRYSRIAIQSDKSDKYLSRESNFALHQFVIAKMSEEEIAAQQINETMGNDNYFKGEITGIVYMIVKEKNKLNLQRSREFLGESYNGRSETDSKVKEKPVENPGFKIEGSALNVLQSLKEKMENE